jgi:alpha-mannosidase
MVRDADGQWLCSQRLSTGELAFVAENVPSLGARRYTLDTNSAAASVVREKAQVHGTKLSNDSLTVTIDEKTGAIAGLKRKDISADLVNKDGNPGLNDYFYVAGRDPKAPQRSGPVKISVKEQGPLVASLLIESDAPGCNKLSRQVRLTAGIDRVDIINVIDKQNIYEQEAVHLAFPFNVPKGIMRMDTPWAVVQPEVDQLDGSCKNYFTVQRWVDVSNADYGVTWVTVDAPLVEVGAITTDPAAVGWLKNIEPSATLYSYVMNNYWETNYKAGQEGPTTFRYSILPHPAFDSGKASKFAIEQSQPLITVPVDGKVRPQQSIFGVEPACVIVTAFKPSEDGKDWLVRLFNTDHRPANAKINWGKLTPKIIWLSSFAEEQVSRLTEPINMSGYEIVTLRIPLPERTGNSL